MKIKAIRQGMRNFENQTEEINEKARRRYEKCKCAFEPASIIKKTIPKDKSIPEISQKLCGECYCVLSFKLRQDIEKCNNWDE